MTVAARDGNGNHGDNGSSPRLVIVSGGEQRDVRAEGFRSPVAFDPQFAVSAALGAGGMPTAVLLDATGRIAAPLAREKARSSGSPGFDKPARCQN